MEWNGIRRRLTATTQKFSTTSTVLVFYFSFNKCVHKDEGNVLWFYFLLCVKFKNKTRRRKTKGKLFTKMDK